jgi:hypothetical protein
LWFEHDDIGRAAAVGIDLIDDGTGGSHHTCA